MMDVGGAENQGRRIKGREKRRKRWIREEGKDN